MVKLTKAEKRAKLKKMRKEAKQQGKEVAKAEVEETPQAAVLVLSNQINYHFTLFMVSTKILFFFTSDTVSIFKQNALFKKNLVLACHFNNYIH